MKYPLFVTIISTAIAAHSPMRGQNGWMRPIPLSSGGQGWEAAAAIDSAGNSLAVWDERTTQDQLWSRAALAGGQWGRVSAVSPALQTTLVFPALRMSAAGFATAVWTDSNGVWTADRPADGKWDPPQLLVPEASAPLFVMNARGDAAVAWTVGGPPGSQSSVMAVLRPSGQAWGSPQTVASGVYVVADHAGISADGAVIVTWELFDSSCSPEGCAEFNFRLHASRNNGAGWKSSPVLLGPDPNSHIAHVALDAGGRALLLALNSSGAYVSTTQGATGGAWGSFNTAVFVNGLSLLTDVLCDNAGDVTMVYEVIGFSAEAYEIDGSTGENTWSTPVLLSGNDNVSQINFAVSPNGEAIAAWLSSGDTDEIHASLRATSTGSWSTPVKVSESGSTEISPEAAAISSSGGAVVVYSGYNANSIHTEYVATYTP